METKKEIETPKSIKKVNGKKPQEKTMNITNNKDLRFVDIRHELFRTYIFPNGQQMRIMNPVALCVMPGHGGHRVVDSEGQGYWIRADFTAITWKSREGHPRVSF